VYRTADGTWRAALVVGQTPDGKLRRRYLSGKTRNAVEDKLRLARAARAAGATDTKVMTVEAWLRYWLDEVAAEEVRVRTLESSYRPKLQRVIGYIGRVRLDKVGPEHLERVYRAMRDEEGLTGSTRLQTHRILHAAFKVAVQRGKMPRNPADLVKAPKADAHEIVPFTIDEARAVLDVLGGEHGVLNPCRYAVALSLGLRQGEALGLRWPDVDLAAGTITVRWQLQRLPKRIGNIKVGDEVPGRRKGVLWEVAAVEGGGRFLLRPATEEAEAVVKQARKQDRDRVVAGQLRATSKSIVLPEGGLKLTRPKTAKSRRTIHMPPKLRDMLKAHRGRQRETRMLEGPRWVGWRTELPFPTTPGEVAGPVVDADLVFPGWAGMPLDPTADSDEWARVLQLAGVPALRLHDARHTAATLMLAAGVPMRVVMEILGHSQIGLTMNTYTHVLDDLHGQAASAMDSTLFKARQTGT